MKLKEVFGRKPKYADVSGLCRAATLAEIAAQGWSLNPGRSVGVTRGEGLSNEDFRTQFHALNEELEGLNAGVAGVKADHCNQRSGDSGSMNKELIHRLTADFEDHAQQTEGGVEYWLARDLQHLLGYVEWRNFNTNAVSKAKTACEISGQSVADHFVEVNKMVDLGSGSQREIEDIMLSRYACYLIAQNGDSRKQEIAFAQTYFAIQTRRAELIEQRLLESERVSARKKLSATEKELSDVIFEQTGGNNDFALIRSKGDQALFGRSTQAMKAQWKVPDSRPLADFAPTIILKAKDFATEITIFNARQHSMGSESAISREHVTNNEAVRGTLLERGIRPESLPAAEDVKRVERRLATEEKKSLKDPEGLGAEG